MDGGLCHYTEDRDQDHPHGKEIIPTSKGRQLIDLVPKDLKSPLLTAKWESQLDEIAKGKRVCQGCILSPCLFNFHAEYIMRNAGLEEAQARIKIAGRNINNLRYEDDTTFMAESEEELKSPLTKVKEDSENIGLKLNIQKTKIMAFSPISSWQIDGETVTNFIFLDSKIPADGVAGKKLKDACSLEEKL